MYAPHLRHKRCSHGLGLLRHDIEESPRGNCRLLMGAIWRIIRGIIRH